VRIEQIVQQNARRTAFLNRGLPPCFQVIDLGLVAQDGVGLTHHFAIGGSDFAYCGFHFETDV